MSKENEAPRRSTRLRVEIPVRLTMEEPAISEDCHTLVVNPQGCGLCLSRALEPGTRVRMDLPGGGSAAAHVANCLPLGQDGKHFLVGVALDEPGNVWGIASPPEDWGIAPEPAAEEPARKRNWPYCLFSDKGEAHPGRR
jgi:hypothetical protein